MTKLGNSSCKVIGCTFFTVNLLESHKLPLFLTFKGE